ncbi:MAG TPA: hypothetical protein VHP34_09690 [Alphaproteobacteria bacterium]|nr:hypothetical protein [Alphaproteobacteria bacterium]
MIKEFIYNKMRNFIILFSVFALLVSLTASFAHADTICHEASSEICASQHLDNAPDDDVAPNDCCDMACGACGMHCGHCHISSLAHDAFSLKVLGKDKRTFDEQKIYISDLIYGLKRPPKA